VAGRLRWRLRRVDILRPVTDDAMDRLDALLAADTARAEEGSLAALADWIVARPGDIAARVMDERPGDAPVDQRVERVLDLALAVAPGAQDHLIGALAALGPDAIEALLEGWTSPFDIAPLVPVPVLAALAARAPGAPTDEVLFARVRYGDWVLIASLLDDDRASAAGSDWLAAAFDLEDWSAKDPSPGINLDAWRRSMGAAERARIPYSTLFADDDPRWVVALREAAAIEAEADRWLATGLDPSTWLRRLLDAFPTCGPTCCRPGLLQEALRERGLAWETGRFAGS